MSPTHEREQHDVPQQHLAGSRMLNHAPTPIELMPSLASALIHWESKLDCER